MYILVTCDCVFIGFLIGIMVFAFGVICFIESQWLGAPYLQRQIINGELTCQQSGINYHDPLTISMKKSSVWDSVIVGHVCATTNIAICYVFLGKHIDFDIDITKQNTKYLVTTKFLKTVSRIFCKYFATAKFANFRNPSIWYMWLKAS